MKLKLALAQINTKLGDVQANLEKHLTLAKQASQDGMDLLVFPELSLTGYVLQDLVPSVACRPDADNPVFRKLLEASREIDLMVGFVDEDTRHRFYIASAYLSRARSSTSTTKSTCQPTGCSTKAASSPRATSCAPSTRVSGVSAC